MEWLKLRAGTASKELQARSFSPSPALRGIPAKGHTLFLFLVLSVRGTGLWSVYVRGGTMRMKRNTQNLSLLERGSEGGCESAQMDLGDRLLMTHSVHQ